jgi:hypothetical protein
MHWCGWAVMQCGGVRQVPVAVTAATTYMSACHLHSAVCLDLWSWPTLHGHGGNTWLENDTLMALRFIHGKTAVFVHGALCARGGRFTL